MQDEACPNILKQLSLSVSLYFELSWPSKLVVSCPDPFHAVKIRICIHSNCIRESVDSLCRDGADAQYLSKSRITSPQI